MKELKCKNCGAHLVYGGWNKYKCEYCGSVYSEEEHRGEIKLLCLRDAKIIPVGACVEVPYDEVKEMGEEYVSQHVMNEIAQKMAEGIAAYMRIDVSRNPRTMGMIVRGEVRVVPADFRF